MYDGDRRLCALASEMAADRQAGIWMAHFPCVIALHGLGWRSGTEYKDDSDGAHQRCLLVLAVIEAVVGSSPGAMGKWIFQFWTSLSDGSIYVLCFHSIHRHYDFCCYGLYTENIDARS